MKRMAKCECGSSVFEVDYVDGEYYWVHKDMPQGSTGCGFVEGSEVELSDKDYDEMMAAEGIWNG